MIPTPLELLFYILAGLFAIVWLYVATRVVTRAIMRTLKDQRKK